MFCPVQTTAMDTGVHVRVCARVCTGVYKHVLAVVLARSQGFATVAAVK